MYEHGIVEEAHPAPKSFLVNQASFPAEQKRVASINLLKDTRETVSSQSFFCSNFPKATCQILYFLPLPLREKTKLPFPVDRTASPFWSIENC